MDAFPPIFQFYRQHCSKRRSTIIARSCTVLVCKILFVFSKPNQSRSETSLNRLDHTPQTGVQSTREAASFNTQRVQSPTDYSASLPDGPRPKVRKGKGELN